MIDGLTTLTGGNTLLLLAILAVGVAIFYRLVYRTEARQARGLTGGRTLCLWALRAVVALLATVALARPAVQLVRREERTPVVALVLDESASMGFPAERGDPLVADADRRHRRRYDSAAAALQRLQEQLTRTHRVKVYAFADTTKLLKELPRRAADQAPAGRTDVLDPARLPDGDYTNLGDAVGDVLRDLAAERVSGIVVASDFRTTGGTDLAGAAAAAARGRVPIYPLVQGTEFPLRDLRIDEAIATPEAALGDVLTFHVKITNQIAAHLEPKLTLLEEGKPVAAKAPRLVRGENLVSISTIPGTEGLREYRLEVERQDDEFNYDNNHTVVHVQVVRRTLRVILAAGKPTPEYLYMVPALLRDPIVKLSCYLQSADIDYVQQGNANIDRLPRTLKEWQDFDVAVLYDVDPNGITNQQIAGLENMVNKGGGLVFIAGRNNGLAKLIQVHATRVRSLLPVEIDKNLYPDYDLYFTGPFDAERTEAGRAHPVLFASTDPEANETLWETFPKFFWSHPAQSVKPQAIVLLERPGAGGGPLMAIQRYGEGAVFYSGIDSLWRWRYPYESFEYDRFWTRVIRYLGETRLHGAQQQVALRTDRKSYSPGETAVVQLRILDPALMAQLAEAEVYASVTSPEKDRHMVRLTPQPARAGVYEGRYAARVLGSLVVNVRQAAPESDSEQKPLFDVSGSFEVKMQSLEDKDTSADLAAAAAVAGKTGGRVADYRTLRTPEDLDALAAAIDTAPQRIERTVRVEVWDGAIFLGLFLVLISAEWCLRKWWGLL